MYKEVVLVMLDGLLFVFVGWLCGYDVCCICGLDLFDLMMLCLVIIGMKYYFYGGKEGVVDIFKFCMEVKYFGVKIVGM